MARWIAKAKYQRTPHAETRVESLWWYKRQPAPDCHDDQPTRESQLVIDAYLLRCARGRKLPEGFDEKLKHWLQELNRPQQVSPRKKRFWTIPAYALAHRLHKFTFCKRFRELEKVAAQLFPNRVPPHRKRVPLTEEIKERIRQRFMEIQDFAAVAHEFEIEPFRVGQLCRSEKAEIIAARDSAASAYSEDSV